MFIDIRERSLQRPESRNTLRGLQIDLAAQHGSPKKPVPLELDGPQFPLKNLDE